MTTITIPSRASEGDTSSITLPPYATAYAGAHKHRRAPFFVPRDQTYYWTMRWQQEEAAALREIADGKARRFSSGASAAEWLLTDDE
jgi:hypothetical protein